jgi:D-glycero-D-manno-heptose 1,7-bisphosphate phosphatase
VGGIDAVFLDRDGTLNMKAPEGSYVTGPGELRLLAGVGRAVRRLNDAGLLVLCVTNQRGVALGTMTMGAVHGVNRELQRRLRRSGARVGRFYVCPHEAGTCNCRKPLPGLLLQAKADYPWLRLANCVMVGDTEHDVTAGLAAGAAAIRLGPPGTVSQAAAVYQGLPGAVDAIMAWAVAPAG